MKDFRDLTQYKSFETNNNAMLTRMCSARSKLEKYASGEIKVRNESEMQVAIDIQSEYEELLDFLMLASNIDMMTWI